MAFFLAPLLAGAAKAALGAAATAGASALASKVAGGGKRGYQQTGTQTVRQEIDFVKMRKNAEAAGLNFLTAAKNGAGAGFVQTHNPILSTREVSGVRQGLADGLVAGVRAAFDYDPLQEQKAQLEYEIMQSQLRNLNAQNSYYTRLGSNLQSRGRSVVQSGPKLANGWKPGEVTVTNPHARRIVDKTKADAETWTTRYEDLVSNVIGVYNAFHDRLSDYRNSNGRIPIGPALGGRTFSSRYPADLKRRHKTQFEDYVFGRPRRAQGW